MDYNRSWFMYLVSLALSQLVHEVLWGSRKSAERSQLIYPGTTTRASPFSLINYHPAMPPPLQDDSDPGWRTVSDEGGSACGSELEYLWASVGGGGMQSPEAADSGEECLV
ncbi:hypothetical protein NDU88_001783 [Pleurodeles waltl]|uniref:Secreted protein n=1 Tax=Pleurodeles waltl TaxID=8319 RepID=A0AAV7S910_PLEWA|nr:hypothetical protein NDU88_001783 [Pleurodeles waltl]